MAAEGTDPRQHRLKGGDWQPSPAVLTHGRRRWGLLMGPGVSSRHLQCRGLRQSWELSVPGAGQAAELGVLQRQAFVRGGLGGNPSCPPAAGGRVRARVSPGPLHVGLCSALKWPEPPPNPTELLRPAANSCFPAADLLLAGIGRVASAACPERKQRTEKPERQGERSLQSGVPGDKCLWGRLLMSGQANR